MIALAGLGLLAILASGCVRVAKLLPVEEAETAGERAAVSSVEGVRIVARGNVWPGQTEILQDTTPLRIRVENGSSVPVRLRYSDFALIGPDGKRYAAIPPFHFEGTVADADPTTDQPTVEDPEFDHSGFSIAPFYRSIHPDLAVWQGGFPYESRYHALYQQYWEGLPWPTPTMLRHALPEGVIAPGGDVDGYVYFERVDLDQSRVHLRADVVDPETGRILGEVTIPFDVLFETEFTEPDPHSR
jgi:hypothetical protein